MEAVQNINSATNTDANQGAKNLPAGRDEVCTCPETLVSVSDCCKVCWLACLQELQEKLRSDDAHEMNLLQRIYSMSPSEIRQLMQRHLDESAAPSNDISGAAGIAPLIEPEPRVYPRIKNFLRHVREQLSMMLSHWRGSDLVSGGEQIAPPNDQAERRRP